MMRPLLPLFSLLLVFWLAGCEGNTVDRSAGPTAAAVLMPEEMPEDFAFSVRFGIMGKKEVNTFNHTITKDLVTHGTAQAVLTFTDREMADIYARLREINILRELNLQPLKQGCSQTPYEEEHWQIQLDGERHSFDWSEENCGVGGDAKKLKELRSYIWERVMTKKEYLELPEAVGGYD